MSTVALHSLVGSQNLPRVNIRPVGSPYFKTAPLFRQLTSVTYSTEKGAKWIIWRWVPEARADGVTDCGFSGVAESVKGYRGGWAGLRLQVAGGAA